MRHFKPFISTSLPLLLAAGFTAPVWAPQAAQADSRLSTLPATTGASAAFVVADRDHPDQRYDGQRNQDQRRNDPQQRDRNSGRDRYDGRDRDSGRDQHRRVWVPGHWDTGFLGIGRHWVPGHDENR